MREYVSHLFSTLLVIILSGVITAAFGYQLIVGQDPCPLCFLQRVGMIGVTIGQLFNFRFGIKMSHHAISLFYCLFGGAVALRQICLHICPGFPSFGMPILGLSLYTWSFLVFVCSLIVIGILMLLYDPKWDSLAFKKLRKLKIFASVYIFVIVVADIITAAYVCGFGICPDN
ncbi:MAG: Disulfide bond formation protein B [Chlamydiae bacterium]|nr:Disulfide bond formation protein B [Chlamydiota bacterium]